MIRARPAFLLYGLVLGVAVPLLSQARLEPCEPQLRSYEAGPPASEPRLELGGRAGTRAGALLFLPAEHTYDPLHPQLARLELEFRRFAPTLALFEGHRVEVAASREETIREYGEAGLLRWLATREGVATRSLEPGPAVEVAALRSRFGAEQVQLTYLMLQAMLYRDRHRWSQVRIEQRMRALLAGAASPALPRALGNLDELDAAFRRHWPPPHHWSDPPADWFDPYLTSTQSGGRFTNEVMRAAAGIRDRHMYRRLVQATQAGERVLALAGAAHLAMQAPALRCALD